MKLSDEDLGRLNEFWLYCKENQYFNVGYPESADFNYSILDKFMQFSINNCGDWREESNYKLNSFEFEKDVMSFFSQLFKISHQESWGYISNGGTEGNLFSCYFSSRAVFQPAISIILKKHITPSIKSLDYSILRQEKSLH